MKPKRKVVTRSPHRTVGLVACAWFQKNQIEYESQLERRFIQRALLTPGITEIVSQPFSIEYGEKSYTPDFLLRLSAGKTFVVEVKPQQFVTEFAEMFDLITPILGNKQMTFSVVTDRIIDVGDLPDDIELLLRYARGSVSQLAVASVLNVFKNETHARSIAQLMDRAQVERPVILHMLGRRILFFKNTISLSDTTFVSPFLSEQNDDYVCIPDWLNSQTWDSNARIRQTDRQQPGSIRRHNHPPRLHVGNREGND